MLDDIFAEAQADARSLDVVMLFEETVEDQLLLLIANADTGIGNKEVDRLFVAGIAYRYASFIGKLYRIVDQVRDDLSQPQTVYTETARSSGRRVIRSSCFWSITCWVVITWVTSSVRSQSESL